MATDPEHPARLWAARRHLWPPGEPFPEAVRWLAPWRDRPGAVIACYAPLPEWTGPEIPDPSGVQLVHVAPDGSPARDRGGLGKRSHGSMAGAVIAMGDPIPEAAVLHVAEGLADALAVAAREAGAVIATGGTSGWGDALAREAVRLGLPVALWPDGDPEGRAAARKLAGELGRLGALCALGRLPDGEDPASMAGPRNTWNGGGG